MPEFFATKFGRPIGHPLVRLAARAEQMSIRLADHVLTCTEEMRQAFVGRGAPPDKITVVLNSADESVFNRNRSTLPNPARFTLISHGSIEERYGLDLVVRAVAALRTEIPGIRLEIFGEGAFRLALERLVDELQCRDLVWLSDGFVPMPDLLDALARADVGLVAMRADAFRDLTHCNKMYEYLTLGLPVISSRTRSVRAYFPDDALQYFTPGDVDDLARAIRELYADPVRRRQLVRNATRALDPYRWPHQRALYRSVVDDLLDEAA
jgi:glycosyltransferase involved in cell wall biosynthesis